MTGAPRNKTGVNVRYKFDVIKMKKRRKEKKLRQADLARLTGLARISITSIECLYYDPSFKTVCLIAEKLELPPGELFIDTWKDR